jgi:hypothetical protein
MDGAGRRIAVSMLLIGALGLTLSGCVGVPAQIMYVIFGHKVEAEFEGLNDKKVAVVCLSDASSYGSNTLTFNVERRVAARLQKNVPKIQLIPQSTVDNWKDQHGWDESDLVQIGRGVGADRVLGIEISSYSLHDGPTMYKGKVVVTSTVFDINDQAIVYQIGPEEHQFPKSGRSSLQMSEGEFELQYLDKLCEHLARRFYEYEKVDGIAEDAGM